MAADKGRGRIIIVGGGLAGLCAAIEGYNQGASIDLIEKQPQLGGNSAKASSGINAVGTEAQKAEKVEDSLEGFKEDTVKSGGGLSDGKLVEVLVGESLSAVEFLSNFGVDLTNLSQCGGHSKPRTHRAKTRSDGKPENIGWGIMSKLIAHVKTLPTTRMRILTQTRVVSLLTDPNQQVVGVRLSATDPQDTRFTAESNLFGDAVVLATGGFSADKELLNKYASEVVRQLPTTNGPWAEGDGIKIASKLDVELVDMDKIQVHPTGIVDPKNPTAQTKFLAPEALRAVGGILVNQQGQRFGNELGKRDDVTGYIFQHCTRLQVSDPALADKAPVTAFLILNDEAAQKFDINIFNFYKNKGFIQSFSNASGLCEKFGIPLANLQETFTKYQEAAANKKDEFGKTLFPLVFRSEEPLHVVLITPSIHYTMGGIKINTEGQVLSKQGEPIPRLFAAGEVSGGVHGQNRLAGNSLLECVVFGRRVGRVAAQSPLISGPIRTTLDFVDKHGILHPRALHPDQWIALTLQNRMQLNSSNHLFRFLLPTPHHQAGLLCGQYIAIRATVDGAEFIRYYSPVSRNSDYGRIDLMIKIENQLDNKPMTRFLRDIQPGQTLEFKGPLGGFEYHRNMYKAVGLIAGGTGITPMMQIMRSVANHPEDKTQVYLVYGNYREEDILCKEELFYWGATRDNIHVHVTLNEPPPHWSLSTGFITETILKAHLPPPAKDIKILLCGPPPMLRVIKEQLKKLDYTDDMLFSYG